MAKKEKSSKAESKVRKKKWFNIVAPKLFNEKSLGETVAYEASELNNRIIEQNMMTLAGDMKRQHLNVKFKVREVVGDKALTDITGVEMYPSAVKRLIRRDKERIDDSFVVKTSDQKQVRIKILVISRSKIARSICAKIKKYSEKIIYDEAEKNTFEGMIEGVISMKLQRMVRDMISRIFPVRTFEIRAIYIEKKKVKIKKKEMIDLPAKDDDEEIIEEASEGTGGEQPADDNDGFGEEESSEEGDFAEEEEKTE